MSVIKLNHLTEFSNNKVLYKEPLTWKDRVEKIATDPVFESTRISLVSNIFKWSIFLGDYSAHGQLYSPTVSSILNKTSDYSNVLSFWNIPNSFLFLIAKVKRIFSCKVFTKSTQDLKVKDYADVTSRVADVGNSIIGVLTGTIFRSPLQLETFLNPALLDASQKSFERSVCSLVSGGLKAVSLTSKIIGGGDKRWRYAIDFFFLVAKVSLVVLIMLNMPLHAAIPLSLATVTLGWGLYKVWRKT